ncbi:hypothetical protein O6H91_03G071300 [Diphasiastrum complanatum]|uniref:Uncharacterized protein n=1 Tax=Diphasiastrum complanatum TaxID=34168 RepID=A0ACC2E7P6_DIPCM|nr:hypothetical protein O6H91_03G071300 [Diphasiastrum complanatum]
MPTPLATPLTFSPPPRCIHPASLPAPSPSPRLASALLHHGSQQKCCNLVARSRRKHTSDPYSCWRVSAVPEGESGEEEAGAKLRSARESEKKNKKEGLESVEALLGREFGGLLWFSVLGACLAIFAGGYVYLVLNYADFSDIPMFRASFVRKSGVDNLS